MIKKINALFMVFLLVCFSFTLYVPEVSAANVDTCGMTTDGNFCVEAPLNQGFDEYDGCASGHLFSGKSIEEVEECNLGTCVPLESKCLSNKPKVECVNENSGAWYDSALSAVPDCQVGCCSYSNSLCSLEEKKYCVHDIAKDDDSAFLGPAYTIDTCNDECRGFELGCYKFPTGGCDYGAREQFSGQAGYVSSNFYSNVVCSAVTECFTTEKTYVGCGDGTTDDDKLDVYYFDSNLNREEIQADCVYPEGVCYDPDGDKGADAFCKSTNCVSDLEEYIEPGEFKSGESLCINVAPYHYTNEGRSTAIKPYILSCQYGDIVADDSIVDRSVVCIEEVDENDRLHAKTITNNWNDCHGCGSGGGILGNAGDVFGFFPPPLSSTFLALTTRPCMEDGSKVVWYGKDCSDRGESAGVQMCGYGPLDGGSNNYDNDLWDPIGSCNPIYPPSVTNKCGSCGKGGDGLLNVCTVDECNSLGDCTFKKDANFFGEATVVGGGLWIGTCTSLALASQLIPIPGLKEGLLAAVATSCGLSAPALVPSIILALAGVSISIGASLSTQGSTGDMAEFDLTNDGKARLGEVLILGKSVSGSYDLSDITLSDTLLAASIGGPSLYYYFGKEIFENGGILTKYSLFDSVGMVAADSAENMLDSFISASAAFEGEEFYQLFDRVYPDTELGKEIADLYRGGAGYGEVQEFVRSEAEKEVLEKSTSTIVSKVISGVLILFSMYSTGQSFNPGKCEAEKPYTNNEKCELCGPGEGQWYCTKERCSILGAGTDPLDGVGHCKWVPKDNEQTDGKEDGLCLPLDVSDASAPVINKIAIEFYDANHILKGTYNANDNNLNVNELIDWNVTMAEVTLETNEEGECGYTKTAEAIYPDGVTSFDYPSPLFETVHETNISFVEADKANPNGIYIYFKCMDINENKIENDNNFISLQFEGRPDTEPPIIKYINPQSVFLPEDTQEITLEVHAYDENEVSSCKYSETSTNFIDMTAFTYGGNVDCADMVQGNGLCNKFTTTVNVASGGVTINFENLTGASENLGGIQNMRTYFYSIKCADGGNNIMYESLNWSLTVVPSYDLDLYGPSGDVYDLTPEFNVSTSNPANCYYTLDGEPSQYYFDELFSYDHFIEHNETLMPGTYSYLMHCEDFAGNVKEDSGSFNVKVIPVSILDVSPNDTTIYFNNAMFEISTDGGWYDNGNVTCKYKETTNFVTKSYNTMIPFEDKEVLSTQTNHESNVSLQGGDKQYYILCRDEMGSQGETYIQNETYLEFTVDFENPPIIIGLYTTSTTLNLILNEDGVCKYSNDDPNFDFGTEGNSMVPGSLSTTKSAALGSSVYYIKCEDSYGNLNDNNPYIVYP